MSLQMDPLDNPLSTRPIETGREFSIEPYPNGRFRFIDNPDRQYGASSVLARTRTRSDGPELLLTLSLSDLASSKDEEDGEDKDDDEEDTELGKLSEDDEPGRGMDTICKTV